MANRQKKIEVGQYCFFIAEPAFTAPEQDGLPLSNAPVRIFIKSAGNFNN